MEQTTFEANGVIRTEDGKEISFDLSLSMARSYHEESNVSIRLGDAPEDRPTGHQLRRQRAQLTSQRFKFDLDSDGQTDEINFVTGGSGFLALDRNGDGKINNGAELFGAKVVTVSPNWLRSTRTTTGGLMKTTLRTRS